MMKQKISILTLFTLVLFMFSCSADSGHPTIYTNNAAHQEMVEKISSEDWASTSFDNLKKEIDTYVDRHQTDPEWIVSRLAMYWKEGEHYTQCYIKNQDWDYGEGNAPVPTVRLPGMRRWNDYLSVPLEDRIPYNETGDLLGISRSSDDKTPVLVPYKETGHMIRANNAEILDLAKKSAFAYWITKEEKYAKFSSDILWTWLMGTYYMAPPKDPEKSSKGLGGYEPGGILGYYDYEVIHDDRQDPAAATYDFIYDYFVSHPSPAVAATGKNPTEIAGVVFKRFIEIGLIRGGSVGNWNVNRYRHIMNSILVLEDDDFYADGKGRQHYIPYYTEITTEYHACLPEIMSFYDPITGLWPESPGYASSMIPTVMQMGLKLYNNGLNTIAGYPMVQKAALANLGWLDARGNLVVFGDMRGGPPDISAFEYLLSYYTAEGDTENAQNVATVIKKAVASGQYNRDITDVDGLCLYKSLSHASEALPYNRAAYSEFHRHMIMKNGNSVENGLMYTLYGGMYQHHLSENGIAVQFYGKGWAMAPDASAYESYWSKDALYHRGVTGSNTVLPGYVSGPITVNAMDPFVDTEKGLYNENTTSMSCSFTDISAEEKRRVIAMVRLSETAGYYVDVFRSNQDDNDYLFHNLGDEFTLYSVDKKALNLKSVDDLGTEYSKDYSYFMNQKKCNYTDDFVASWRVTKHDPVLCTDLWMMGQNKRALYTVEAPPTTLRADITPAQVNKAPEKTPTLIVRQNGINGQAHPFVSVYESYYEKEKQIENITKLVSTETFTSLKIAAKGAMEQIICSATDDKMYQATKDIKVQATFAIASTHVGNFDYFYLGRGKEITSGEFSLKAVSGIVSAELRNVNGKYYYSADQPVVISTKNSAAKTYAAGYNVLLQ